MAREIKEIYPRKCYLEYSKVATPFENRDIPIYNWFSFRHAFGRSLVFKILETLNLTSNAKVIDPFCGSGTTLLACREKDISTIGLDILPLSVFITNVKLRNYSIPKLKKTLDYLLSCPKNGTPQLPEIPILKKSFTHGLRQEILDLKGKINSIKTKKERDFFNLVLFRILGQFSKTSNDGAFLRLKPDKKIEKKNFLPSFLNTSDKMIKDIQDTNIFKSPYKKKWGAYQGDARYISNTRNFFDAVITSPPYLNRHDYTRVYILELALGFVKTHEELKKLRYNAFCSHVEAKTNLNEIDFIFPSLLTETLNSIQKATLNNSNINRTIEGYFVDFFRFLKSIYQILKYGGQIALVLGNVRFGGIIIPVDQIIVEIAKHVGFKYKDIWTIRIRGNSPQQMKRYGKIPSLENIVFLKK